MIFKENGEIKRKLRFLTLYYDKLRSNGQELITTQAKNSDLSRMNVALCNFQFWEQVIFNEQVTDF